MGGGITHSFYYFLTLQHNRMACKSFILQHRNKQTHQVTYTGSPFKSIEPAPCRQQDHAKPDCRCEKLPSGSKFMPQTRARQIAKMARRAKGVAKIRMLAACMRKKGKSIRKIAAELCVPSSTVYDWLLRIHKRGPKGRFDKRRRGRKRILDNNCLGNLREWLAEGSDKHGLGSGSWQWDTILELIRARREQSAARARFEGCCAKYIAHTENSIPSRIIRPQKRNRRCSGMRRAPSWRICARRRRDTSHLHGTREPSWIVVWEVGFQLYMYELSSSFYLPISYQSRFGLDSSFEIMHFSMHWNFYIFTAEVLPCQTVPSHCEPLTVVPVRSGCT